MKKLVVGVYYSGGPALGVVASAIVKGSSWEGLD